MEHPKLVDVPPRGSTRGDKKLRRVLFLATVFVLVICAAMVMVPW